VRRDEEKCNIYSGVLEPFGEVIGALSLVLVGQIDGALLPDVLQDWLFGVLLCVVPCQRIEAQCILGPIS